MDALSGVSADGIISSDWVWPAHSFDLDPCDICVWRTVCKSNCLYTQLQDWNEVSKNKFL